MKYGKKEINKIHRSHLKGVGEDTEAEVADDEPLSRIGNVDGGRVVGGGLGVIEYQVAHLAGEGRRLCNLWQIDMLA